MEKNKKRLQKFVKVCNTIAKVVYVCVIIGMVGTLIGLVSLIAVQNFKVDGQTVKEIIDASKNSYAYVLCSCIFGFGLCLGEFFVVKKAKEFFNYELSIGEPFDKVVADKLLHLGIYYVWVPFVAEIASYTVAAIVYFILLPNATSLDFGENVLSISLGLVMILISYILKYGASVKEEIAAK